MTNITVIEQRDVTRDYDLIGSETIIDHPKHGRLLVTDGFGGIDSPCGGAVRFDHGLVVSLKKEDTFNDLNCPWNDYMDTHKAVINGFDSGRPVLNWNGSAITSLSKHFMSD